MTDDIDARIGALLKLPEGPADERFVAATMLQVEAEARLRAIRARARSDFVFKASACVAVLLAFVLLARLDPPQAAHGEISLLSPTMLGFILLGLWAAIDLPVGSLSRR